MRFKNDSYSIPNPISRRSWLNLALAGVLSGDGSRILRGSEAAADSSAAYRLLIERKYLELSRLLSGSGRRDDPEWTLVAGVLANRQNRIVESTRLLTQVCSHSSGGLSAERATIVLRTLADNYWKSNSYGKAADNYKMLLESQAASLSPADRQDIEGSQALAELFRRAPGQAVSRKPAFEVRTSRNVLGLIEAPVTVGGRKESVILDSGANLSVITQSGATRFGLTVSAGTAPIAGASGVRCPCHAAVIPSVILGGAEFRNVSVIVMDDKDLYIEPLNFQIGAILGYPVLAALQRITFFADGRFAAGPASGESVESGSRMFMEDLNPLVAAVIEGTTCLCMLDTGAAVTHLNERYFRDHRSQFAGARPEAYEFSGAGHRTLACYIAPQITVALDGVPVVLKDVHVLAEPRTDKDYFYANLGQDILGQLRGYSIDFRAMRFYVVPATSPQRVSTPPD
jgi:predicted aspartyl protease